MARGSSSYRLFQLIRRSARRSSASGALSLSVVAGAGLAPDAAATTPAPAAGLSFEFGLACLPHPDKLAKGGEDAYFFNHSVRAFGVADGVGAWSTMGIDPARFSRQLMRRAEYAIIRDDDQAEPVPALRTAYDGVRRLGVPGSCTALVGVLRRDGTLLLANLGDSGAMILAREDNDDDDVDLSKLSLSDKTERAALSETKLADAVTPAAASASVRHGFRIAFRTTEQLHRFNCPFQLGLESSDVPESAEVSRHVVKVGDVIVAGSDGLWDNLFDDDVRRLADQADDVTELAFIIATAASRRASKTRGASATPFAVDAAEAGIAFEGGKMDDITVIVARVVPARGLEDEETMMTARARL